MRILLLSDRIPPENKGGAEKVAWAAARGLRDRGHEVSVIAATPDAPFEAIRDGIPTYHLHVAYPTRFNAYLSLYNPQVNGPLKRLYQQIQPEVIGAYNIHRDLTYHSLTLASAMEIPVVITLQDVMAFSYSKLTHFIDPARCEPKSYRLPPFYNLKTMRLRYNPLRNWTIQRVLRDSTQLRIAGSESLRQALAANDLPDFRVLYASIISSDFEVAPSVVDSLRTRLDLQGKQVILFAGRLSRDKGSHELLKALGRVIKTHPNVRLLTLTRATLAEQGLETPQYQHLRPYITIGGWLQGEELAAAYQLAEVVTVPSICLDVFPTINLEAMAAGKPVIATCYGGSSEAVIDGQTGYIVNPFDTETFAARLTHLLTNPQRAQAMGQAGRERLLRDFTPEQHITQLERFYHEAILRQRG
ncbi:MAG: glycosyltransferase family 4 protein [Anaerolineae bacterium]|jgi:glycosyltransferase involved in cell wall biosynthesis|nr:glycosyltransferase family 4 protein [Anaerolineae bacterium]